MKKTIKLITLLLMFTFSGLIQAATVNLNTATKEELMTLKGVGEARADAIMKYRRTTKFSTPSDVQNVPGIGETIYKDNARSMKASGRTTAKVETKSVASKKTKAKKEAVEEKKGKTEKKAKSKKSKTDAKKDKAEKKVKKDKKDKKKKAKKGKKSKDKKKSKKKNKK